MSKPSWLRNFVEQTIKICTVHTLMDYKCEDCGIGTSETYSSLRELLLRLLLKSGTAFYIMSRTLMDYKCEDCDIVGHKYRKSVGCFF